MFDKGIVLTYPFFCSNVASFQSSDKKLPTYLLVDCFCSNYNRECRNGISLCYKSCQCFCFVFLSFPNI